MGCWRAQPGAPRLLFPPAPSPEPPVNANFAPNERAREPGLDALSITAALSIVAHGAKAVCGDQAAPTQRSPAANVQAAAAESRSGGLREPHRPGARGSARKGTEKTNPKRLFGSTVAWPATSGCWMCQVTRRSVQPPESTQINTGRDPTVLRPSRRDAGSTRPPAFVRPVQAVTAATARGREGNA